GGQVRGLPAAAEVDPEVDRALQGVGGGVQDGRADDVPLRLRRAADGDDPAGERGVPVGDADRVGRGGDEDSERPGGGAVSAARVPGAVAEGDRGGVSGGGAGGPSPSASEGSA